MERNLWLERSRAEQENCVLFSLSCVCGMVDTCVYVSVCEHKNLTWVSSKFTAV